MSSKWIVVAVGAMACGGWGVDVMAQDHKPQGGGAAPAHQHMEHRFTDVERYAKSFDDPARDLWQMPGRVIEALGIRAGMTVADVGAGTGYFSVRLARTPGVQTVYSVDIEQAMVDYLRQRAAKEGLKNVVPVLAAADRTNLPQPVDLVLVVDTYHHIPNRAAYFRELQKSMKPGARLAIIDFRRDSPEGPPVEFRFTPEQVENEIAPAGFRVVARHDFLPRQYFLVFQAGGR
jgi:ubiquinone/menaquinone biosynthesis C-methylase UbiE